MQENKTIFIFNDFSRADHLLFWIRAVKFEMRVQILIYFILFIGAAKSAENSVTINVKNAVNVISDRFISYEIDFSDMMKLYLDQNSFKNLSVISPAYIKLRGFSSYLKNEENNKFSEGNVAELMETLK